MNFFVNYTVYLSDIIISMILNRKKSKNIYEFLTKYSEIIDKSLIKILYISLFKSLNILLE